MKRRAILYATVLNSIQFLYLGRCDVIDEPFDVFVFDLGQQHSKPLADQAQGVFDFP